MAVTDWILSWSVFILVLVVIFGIAWWIRNHQSPGPEVNTYSAPIVWGPSTPSSTPGKNVCSLYQFPSTLVTIGTTGTVVPGTPTFSSSVLDNLTGIPRYPACTDSDQIMAQQVEHVCTAPSNIIDPSITRCYLMNGGLVKPGAIETYYTNSTCTPVKACPGQISLVSINFQGPLKVNPLSCIQSGVTGTAVTMNNCDPLNEDQLFQ